MTSDSPSAQHWVLTLTCPDRPGIVHAVSAAVVAARGNIAELQQFSNSEGHFFMRIQVDSAASRAELESTLGPVAEDLGATWNLDHLGRPKRTLILASKAAHCLNDLLFRQRSGWLPIEVPLVLANHPDLTDLAQFYGGVPLEHHAVLPETKAAFERRIMEAVEEYDIELVVLARYMQILSPQLCEFLHGRAINIHHSFLPGFKGANPYRQAYERGGEADRRDRSLRDLRPR